MKKDLKKIVKALREQGFETQVTKNGHVQVFKDGQRVTTFSGSASDHRSHLNAIARCKRAGFIWH